MRNLMAKLILLALIAAGPLLAAIEERQFDTQEQLERYRQLTDDLRCPLCLNSNLSGSDAPIAADLRQEIYEQIVAGRSDGEIIDFMTERYGDFILYRPPVTPGTYVLWFGPPVILLAGLLIARRLMKSSQTRTDDSALSAEEQRKLSRYLQPDPEKQA